MIGERENMDERNDTGMKMLCSFFVGIILTGLGAYIGYPHDLPTKADLAIIAAQTQKQNDEVNAQQAAEETQITSLRIEVGKIADHLHIPDESQ